MKELTSGTDGQIFGKLGSVSLNDIVQLLDMSKRTATIELRRGDERGRVYVREGQIIHATAEDYEGEESFIELLGWADADFAVEDGIASLPKISINKSTNALLLSTMTTLDEVARVTGRPPISVAPSITQKRLPPRPKPRPTRSARSRARVISAGLATMALIPLASLGFLGASSSWNETPWQELPLVNAPAHEPRPVGVWAPGSTTNPSPHVSIPDAWTVASTVWEQTPAAQPPPGQAQPLARVLPVGPGYLTVVVEPWARVTIDGLVVGETPLAPLELPAGVHQIVLENDHIVGVLRDELAIEPGESATRRYSFSETGYLGIVATPWADVSVDGRAIGQTPLARVAVPEGEHVVRFAHPELGELERNVVVVSGETTLVKVQLQ